MPISTNLATKDRYRIRSIFNKDNKNKSIRNKKKSIIERLNQLYILLLLAMIFLSSYQQSKAQDISIDLRSESIVINSDTTFTRYVTSILKENEEAVLFPIFFDSELEKVTDVRLYTKKGKKYKLQKNPIISDEDIKLDQFTSKKVRGVLIPPGEEAKIEYRVDCNELMYFTSLPFFTYHDTDTIKYQVTVPKGFHFKSDVLFQDSLEYLSTIPSKMSDKTNWEIEVVPNKIVPDPLSYFGIYRDLKMPLMRVIVVPDAYKEKEKEYMNDWYLEKVKTRRGLNMAAIEKINEITKGMSDKMEIISTLYGYVQNNFKYVAIEIGMGAFVPSLANEVFLNKHGDCKDLSNFLSEALEYKGIRSEVALASTFNHISDCDFPSLCAANHVICVAYVNKTPILLDPTDPIHLPGSPIQSLQDRSIFIIDDKGGEFHSIDIPSPELNEVAYNLTLHVDTDTGHEFIEGDFTVSYAGISGNFLRRWMKGMEDDKKMTIGKEHFTSIFGGHDIKELQVDENNNVLVAKGKIAIKGKMIKDKNEIYLFIDFLPRIMETEDSEGPIWPGTHLGSSIHKKVRSKVIFDMPIEEIEKITRDASGEGITLKMEIEKVSANVLELNYDLISKGLSIDKENLDIYKKILGIHKKLTNEPIILKNKS